MPHKVTDTIKIVFMSGSMLSHEQLHKITLHKNVLKFIPKPINKTSLNELLSLGTK